MILAAADVEKFLSFNMFRLKYFELRFSFDFEYLTPLHKIYKFVYIY